MSFYVPLNLLLDFHREQERFKNVRNRDDPSVVDERSRMLRELPSDPLGMAVARFRPGERLRAGAAGAIRFLQVGTRREA